MGLSCAISSKAMMAAGWRTLPCSTVWSRTSCKPRREAIATEGWKWIEVSTDLPYGYSHGLRRLVGDPSPLSEEEAAEARQATRGVSGT